MADLISAQVGRIELIDKINQFILNPIIKLLFAVAFIIFIWGVVEFIFGQDNEEKVAAGKRHMLWAIIGFFIMLSVFGIINLIIDFLKGL